MNGGIIGEDCFLAKGALLFPLLEPLILAFSILSLIIVTRLLSVEMLSRAGIWKVGEVEGLRVLSELEGVIIKTDFVVVLELDRECCIVLRDSQKEDLFVVAPDIAQNQVPHTIRSSMKCVE